MRTAPYQTRARTPTARRDSKGQYRTRRMSRQSANGLLVAKKSEDFALSLVVRDAPTSRPFWMIGNRSGRLSAPLFPRP
jgi:hypothetical protein